MAKVDLIYHIDLHTGIHIGSGLGFAKMVDETICRAGSAKGDGAKLPYVPGSSVKGKVKSRCESLANRLNIRVCKDRKCKQNLCVICRLFGSPFTPGGLRFSDAILVKDWENIADHRIQDPFELSIIRTGNKLERATRTTEQDFLFSYEQTADGLRFEGAITGEVNILPQDAKLYSQLSMEIWLLIVGLQLVDKIGGGRSHGLGRCSINVDKINGNDLQQNQILNLLGQDQYLLGLSDYDQRNNSNN